ncbi:hypothetical protein BH09ACT12_BH09ACT12_12920 [soil metagenome]
MSDLTGKVVSPTGGRRSGYIADVARDIASADAFLLDEDSHSVTGQVFMVDGGQYVSPGCSLTNRSEDAICTPGA